MRESRKQRLVRLAQLRLQGMPVAAVCEDLGISEATFYRDIRSPEYKTIGGTLGVAPAPEHPEMQAARDIAARTERTIAEKIEEGVTKGLDTIIEMMECPQDHKLGEVVAATKFLLEQHLARTGTAGMDDSPLSAEEVERARRMMGAA